MNRSLCDKFSVRAEKYVEVGGRYVEMLHLDFVMRTSIRVLVQLEIDSFHTNLVHNNK